LLGINFRNSVKKLLVAILFLVSSIPAQSQSPMPSNFAFYASNLIATIHFFDFSLTPQFGLNLLNVSALQNIPAVQQAGYAQDFIAQNIFSTDSILAILTLEIGVLPLSIIGILLIVLASLGYYLHRAQKSMALAESKSNFFSSLFDVSPVPFVVYNDLKIIYANSAFERLSAYSRKEVSGNNICDFVHAESFADTSVVNWFLARKNQSWSSDLLLVCKNNQTKWVHFSAQIIDFNGEKGFLGALIDISHRQEEKSRENELLTRQTLLLHSCSEGLFDYNIQNRELFLSLQWKEMLGYTENEILNTFSSWQSLIHTEDLLSFDEFMRQVIDGIPSGKIYEFRTKCRDNSFKWVQVKFSVAFGDESKPTYVLGVQNDVSRIKELEGHLHAANEVQSSLFTANHLPVLLVDKHTRNIVAASYGASKLYGYTQEEFQNLKLYDILHATANYFQSQAHEKTIHKTKNNSLIHVEVYQNTVVFNGRETEVLTIIDVTANQLEISGLRQAKESSEKSSLLKSNFLSGVSHEIRTPLNSIVGLVELIVPDETLPEALRENLKSIKFSSKHLLGVINDVLDFSKLEAGKVILDTDHFNLIELINETTKSIEHKTNPKGIHLKVHINPNLPDFVLGDEGRIRQVLLNLLSNAAKFTSEGNINVYAKLSEVKDQYCKVRISVSDTGIGIPESKIKAIFDSYIQADQRIFRKYGGTGLGLPICKKLVELLGGEIGVKSIESIGSNFWFEVPLELTSKPKSNTKDNPISMENKNLQGLKVLLVEDDSMNRFVMAQFFKKWNAQLVEAENGNKAIELLSKEQFDIVLMDLHMPDLDGIEATRIIRQGSPSIMDSNIPIIALTADVSEDVKEKIRSVGMDDLVIKPSEPEILYNKICTLTNLNRKKRVLPITNVGLTADTNLTGDECELKKRTIAALQAIFEDDRGSAHSMLMHFEQQLPRITTRVQLYIDKGVGELAAQSLHRIKPGFQHLGFHEVVAQLEELQAILRNPKQRNLLPQKLSKFLTDLEEVQKVLKSVASELESQSFQGLN